jgi:hypothetical protein
MTNSPYVCVVVSITPGPNKWSLLVLVTRSYGQDPI